MPLSRDSAAAISGAIESSELGPCQSSQTAKPAITAIPATSAARKRIRMRQQRYMSEHEAFHLGRRKDGFPNPPKCSKSLCALLRASSDADTISLALRLRGTAAARG